MFKKIIDFLSNSRWAPFAWLGIFIIICAIIGLVVFLCTPGVSLNFPAQLY